MPFPILFKFKDPLKHAHMRSHALHLHTKHWNARIVQLFLVYLCRREAVVYFPAVWKWGFVLVSHILQISFRKKGRPSLLPILCSDAFQTHHWLEIDSDYCLLQTYSEQTCVGYKIVWMGNSHSQHSIFFTKILALNLLAFIPFLEEKTFSTETMKYTVYSSSVFSLIIEHLLRGFRCRIVCVFFSMVCKLSQ